MPTRLDTNFARLSNADEFESMIRDICALEWDDPHTEKYGRSGQKQNGVDIYGRPSDLNGNYYAAQCKLRKTGKQLSQTTIKYEVNAARQFPHSLALLILATDTARDTDTQILVNQISTAEERAGSFRVIIWFWDDITTRLAAYPQLIIKYYRDYFANLTTLPLVERLIDTPLQIICPNQSPSNERTVLEEHLTLRGIRIAKVTHRGHNTFAAPQQPDSSSPDGVLLQYCGTAEIAEDVTLLRLVNTITAYIQLIDSHCPLFVVLPLHLHPTLIDTLDTLGIDLNRIQVLDSARSPVELANHLLTATFAYGYARRGGLATVNIAVRSSESRVNSVLLDLDWCTRLGIDRFPTCDEWDNLLKPALMAVKQQLVSQSDHIRVQFHCQLPLPAAFALGFVFNVRVAHIGVWARKTGVSDFRRQFWLSDSDPAPIHYEPIWIQRTDGCGQVAVVELTSYVSILKAVEAFVDMADLAVDTWVQLPLMVEGKSVENLEEGHALAYAKQVAQLIRTLNEQGVTDIHLFARIPAALAVLIGQRLVACGRIHLYWFDNPNYRFALTLV